jgi:hypothetical protein
VKLSASIASPVSVEHSSFVTRAGWDRTDDSPFRRALIDGDG